MLVLVLGPVGSAGARNSASVADAAGDAAGAADITSVTVSNDDVLLLTWKITLADRPALLEGDEVIVWLDVDGLTSTGEAGTGYDYSVTAFGPTRTRVVSRTSFSLWSANRPNFTGAIVFSEWDPATRVLSLSVNSRSIDFASTFRVAVESVRQHAPGRDLAPEAGARIPFEVVGDRIRPAVRALAAQAQRGKTVSLRYQVTDENPTSEEITLFRGTKRIARFGTRLRPFTQRNLAFRWRVPKRLARGNLRFCVVAQDEWRNFSERACASLRVR